MKKRESKTEHSTRFAGVMCPKADSQTLQVSMRGNALRIRVAIEARKE